MTGFFNGLLEAKQATGGAGVIVRGRGGPLYGPAGPSTFEKVKRDEAQMCVAMALFGVG
jgi:hypothetical protein